MQENASYLLDDLNSIDRKLNRRLSIGKYETYEILIFGKGKTGKSYGKFDYQDFLKFGFSRKNTRDHLSKKFINKDLAYDCWKLLNDLELYSYEFILKTNRK